MIAPTTASAVTIHLKPQMNADGNGRWRAPIPPHPGTVWCDFPKAPFSLRICVHLRSSAVDFFSHLHRAGLESIDVRLRPCRDLDGSRGFPSDESLGYWRSSLTGLEDPCRGAGHDETSTAQQRQCVRKERLYFRANGPRFLSPVQRAGERY